MSLFNWNVKRQRKLLERNYEELGSFKTETMCPSRSKKNTQIIFLSVAMTKNTIISYCRKQEKNFTFKAEKPPIPVLCFIMHNWNSSQLQKCKLLLIASICTWNREIRRSLIVKELWNYILICFEGIKINLESESFL